jgi:hypothetical protein
MRTRSESRRKVIQAQDTGDAMSHASLVRDMQKGHTMAQLHRSGPRDMPLASVHHVWSVWAARQRGVCKSPRRMREIARALGEAATLWPGGDTAHKAAALESESERWRAELKGNTHVSRPQRSSPLRPEHLHGPASTRRPKRPRARRQPEELERPRPARGTR